MTLTEETKFLMKKYNLNANKKLGQNFLIDEEIVNKIIETANISKNDIVIEIGPGLGTLTKLLLEEAGKVICIELDERMVKILNDRFSTYENFNLINEDVLKVDLNKLISESENTKIVANLPYYITTPIIMKLLESELNINDITVMIQKEVADRLVAKPGGVDTGAITYAINYYTIPTRALQVPNTAFIPAPEVNSTVINLEILKTPPVNIENKELFFNIIKTAFMQRRKTLLNALANSNMYGSKEEIEKILVKLNIDVRIRAEKLNLEDFARLTKMLTK